MQELGEDMLDPDYVTNKLIELEDRSRRNNIRIDGIEDDQNETWDSCEEKVQKLIKEKLGLELLDHDSNKKVHDFLNIIYRNSMILTINKPTRVTRKTATAIDHILKNCFIDRTFKTAIFRSDISDHFPICFIIPSMKTKIKNETSFLYKRNFSTEAKHAFQNELYETNWKDIETFTDPNEAYKAF